MNHFNTIAVERQKQYSMILRYIGVQMRKSLLVLAAFAGLTCSNVQGQGFLSSIKDKLTGAEQQEQQQAQQPPQQQPIAQGTPAPAERGRTVQGEGGNNVKIVQGTPPTQAQKTPTKEEIKKGAARLKTQMAPERIPGNLFDNYEGIWNGDFWVYSPQGQLEESKSVKIEYKKTGKNTLSMETFYADRLGKQWIVAETATYTNTGDAVEVSILRPSNETAMQTGRFNDGQLFLVANIKDGVEHYRERIDGQRLLVDGFAVYGGSDSHVFIGRFVRQR